MEVTETAESTSEKEEIVPILTCPGKEASFVTELLQTSVKERFKQSVRQQATEIKRIDVSEFFLFALLGSFPFI